MANSGHCWVLDDLAIERIMKGRMSCRPADGGVVGGLGLELSLVQALLAFDSGS